MNQQVALHTRTPDADWLRSTGARVALRAGLLVGTGPDGFSATVSVPADTIITACAALSQEDRARLCVFAAQHVDPEEITTWLMAPSTKDHVLLDKALFPEREPPSVSKTEMQYDWDRGSLIKEKTGPALAIFSAIAVLVETGTILEAEGPLHLHGTAGVLVSAASAATMTWLATKVIKGLFRTHPSTAEQGGQSVWRSKLDTLARLCQGGVFTEEERYRIAQGAEAFSSADRLLIQHLSATDFARFMLADDDGRTAILEKAPPPPLSRMAASWHNQETRLAIGRLGFGKGLLADRLASAARRRQELEALKPYKPSRPSP